MLAKSSLARTSLGSPTSWVRTLLEGSPACCRQTRRPNPLPRECNKRLPLYAASATACSRGLPGAGTFEHRQLHAASSQRPATVYNFFDVPYAQLRCAPSLFPGQCLIQQPPLAFHSAAALCRFRDSCRFLQGADHLWARGPSKSSRNQRGFERSGCRISECRVSRA